MENSEKGTLYLIPAFLSEDSPPGRIFPPVNLEIIKNLKIYIAEHAKNARRFLKKVYPEINQPELVFFELNKHTRPEEIPAFITPLLKGNDVGLLSDAGMPAIADPGAIIVREAHKNKIKVVPLTGPSSLLLALAASGLNGQNFHFHGYLPIDKVELKRKINRLVKETYNEQTTHIFIETPYRNKRLLETLIKMLPDEFTLCLAIGLTSSKEKILCQNVTRWKKKMFDPGKIPTVFLFGI